MGVEVRLHFGVGDVRGLRRGLPRVLEQRIAEDRAQLLLRLRVLVVALLARLLREELDVDHLLQKLFSPLRRLVSHAIELIHVLQRGDVVTERDRLVADAREHFRGLVGGEQVRRRVGSGVARAWS